MSHLRFPAGDPQYTSARRRTLWAASNTTQRHLRDANMVADHKNHQLTSLQHGSAPTHQESDRHDVQSCKNRMEQVLTGSHALNYCAAAAAGAKSARQLIRGSEHPRVSPGAFGADKSGTAAGIVTESDQAAFVSNHSDSKTDVT